MEVSREGFIVDLDRGQPMRSLLCADDDLLRGLDDGLCVDLGAEKWKRLSAQIARPGDLEMELRSSRPSGIGRFRGQMVRARFADPGARVSIWVE